jgi:hypothetical protein
MAPSQPTAAVAGVQKLSRQQSSLEPFFHTNSELPLRQLSIVWAPAAVASAAVANSIATLFNFFIILLVETNRSRAANVLEASSDHHPRHDLYCAIHNSANKEKQEGEL